MKLLVIVDMINGFVYDGNMAFTESQAVIDSIVKLATHFTNKNYDILAFRDEHLADSLEFRAYPVHCLKGSTESELISELQIFENIIDNPKRSTNGVNTPQFQALLQEKTYTEIVVVGVCTDICVLQTTLSLITQFYENNLDIKVSVVSDAVATFDSEAHNGAQYHDFALALMSNANANITTLEDIIEH